MESINAPSRTASAPRRWPLFFIALPAAVAIWSGWVGLGGMCGFGLVQPLPGIVRWHLDTSITLPVGVEAYGAFALGVWLRPNAIPDRARSFAKKSAIGALATGATGQIIFHLLAAGHRTRAPWPVILLVACLPIAVVGFGAGLMHLLRADETEQDPEPEPVADIAPEQPVPVVATAAEAAARAALEATIKAGNPLSRNQLETRFRLTRAEATKLRGELIPERGRDSATPAVPAASPNPEPAAGADQGPALAAMNGAHP